MNETNPTKRVVVGYDGSTCADDALSWAAGEAARLDLPLHVVVARPGLPARAFEIPETDSSLPGRGESILAAAGLADVSVETTHEPPGPALRQASGPADLLVVGSLGHGRVAGALLGSVSRYLAHHADCPVVVVRPAAAAAHDIAVGLDGSPESIAALGWACQRGRHTSEQVVAFHGYRTGVPGGGLGVDQGDVLAQHVVRAEKQVRDWVDHAPILDASTVQAEAAAVPAGELLVKVSEHAALVVVGARGRGAVPGVHLGSVAGQVLARAQCPVVVVR